MVRTAQCSILFTRAITVLALGCALELHAQPGALDPSFTPLSGTQGSIKCFATLTDGKILAAGNFSSYDGTPRAGVVRLNEDGTLDASFTPLCISGSGPNYYDIAVLPNGDFVLAAFGPCSSPGVQRVGLFSYNADGSPNSNFTLGGALFAVAAQSDGKVLIGGIVTS